MNIPNRLIARNAGIPTVILKDILDEFFSELNYLDGIDDEIISNQKDVLVDSKKPKADNLVKIFCQPEEDIT